MPLTCAPFVYLSISAKSECQARNQKLAAGEPGLARKMDRRLFTEAIVQGEAEGATESERTCGLLFIRKPLLRKRTSIDRRIV